MRDITPSKPTSNDALGGHSDGYCTVHKFKWPASVIACDGHRADGRACEWAGLAFNSVPMEMYEDCNRLRAKHRDDADALRALLVKCDSMLGIALHRGTDEQWAFDADALIRSIRRESHNGSYPKRT